MEILNVESREAGEYFVACELNAKRVKLAQPILLKLLTHTHHNSKHTCLYYFKKTLVNESLNLLCHLPLMKLYYCKKVFFK